MNSITDRSRSVLVEFFRDMEREKGWHYRLPLDLPGPKKDAPTYSIDQEATKESKKTDMKAKGLTVEQVFPSLAGLLFMPDTFIQALLLNCKLCMRKKNSTKLSVNRIQWDSLIAEFKLDVELTPAGIDGPRGYFLKVGSFEMLSSKESCSTGVGSGRSSVRLGGNSPLDIWNQICKGERVQPRIRMKSRALKFASALGEILSQDDIMSLILPQESDDEPETIEIMDDAVEVSDTQLEKELSEQLDAIRNEGTTGTAAEPVQYPWLAKFGVPIDNDLAVNGLIQDLLRLNAKRSGETDGIYKNHIRFVHANNKCGMLATIPKVTSQLYYDRAEKRTGFMRAILSFLVDGTDNTLSDAAKWVQSSLAKEYEDEFMIVAEEQGLDVSPKVMDAASAAAMWQESNTNVAGQRTIISYFRSYFGRRFVVPEAQVRALGKDAYRPTCKHLMQGQKKIHFWYKEPDKFLRHLVQTNVLSEKDLQDVKQVDLPIGGDHGKGKFRMVMKVVIRYNDPTRPAKSMLLQVGEIDCAQDDLQVLKDSLLTPIGDGMARIVKGGRFCVSKDVDDTLDLSFDVQDGEDVGNDRLCDVPIHVFVVGDLKFFASILGRNNMAGAWCMWCLLSPAEWKIAFGQRTAEGVPEEHGEPWTMTKLKNWEKTYVDKKVALTPSDIRGVVEEPLWDFVDVCHFLFPVLHCEIGLGNDILDSLYDWIDDRVEKMSPELVALRNARVAAEISYNKSLTVLLGFLKNEHVDMLANRSKRAQLNRDRTEKRDGVFVIEDRGTRQQMAEEAKSLSPLINAAVKKRKELENDQKVKKKLFESTSAAYNALRKEEHKLDDRCVREKVHEDILGGYKVESASYHGGKLNGVAVRRLMVDANDIFDEITTYLLTVDHSNRCPEDEIRQRCEKYADLLLLLDKVFSILRKTHGNVTNDDYTMGKRFLDAALKLWNELELSHTPKWHSLLEHALEQMIAVGGFGDMLEDDVERSHALAGQAEIRMAGLNGYETAAVAQSTWEHASIKSSVVDAKDFHREKRKRNVVTPARGAKVRKVAKKEKREQTRDDALVKVEADPAGALGYCTKKTPGTNLEQD